ncbi:MAG: Gfo/Idh/MocA family oxidoreductase [Verrucomicrobia bacterium]|nr:Gfo/Idh/MocA family oxidoreductase [Verrucomicrobiota bacterium]
MTTRRSFLRTTSAAATLAFPSVRRSLAAAAGSANEAVRLAVIGLGGKGKSHVKQVLGLPEARLTALCDVDPERLSAQVAVAREAGLQPFTATDPRRILERPDVDAVIIATPNHWHALLTIWACRAGKDVYVEKPISHQMWEGAQMVAITRQTGRIVQSGTQYRSDEGIRAAAAWIKEGHIGKPKFAHVAWYEYRPGIGRAAPHRPTTLDYDLYCGPAAAEPLTRPKLHYDWHWVWSTGDGDLGNSGVHPIDACRMMAGLTDLPRRALCLGGRFGVDDAGETPNTQLTLLDYPGLPMLVENRNLPAKAGQKAMDQFRGIREGFALDCEGGSFVGLKGGGWIYDRDGKRLKQFPGEGGSRHMLNFLRAVRSRRAEDLNAPVLQGHYSAVLCHIGNLSWRLGRPESAAACRDAVRNHPGAAAALEQFERHLVANDLESAKARFVLGPWLELDPSGETIRAVSGADASTLARARALARGSHRAPYNFVAV